MYDFVWNSKRTQKSWKELNASLTHFKQGQSKSNDGHRELVTQGIGLFRGDDIPLDVYLKRKNQEENGRRKR